MLFAFNSTAVMTASVILTYGVGIFIIVFGKYFLVQNYIGIGIIIMGALANILLVMLKNSLYKESVKRCGYDIDGFYSEHKSIVERSFGKSKTVAQLNMIEGLITYERFNDAAVHLRIIQPKMENTRDIQNKIKYLYYMLSVYRYRKDYENFALTVEQLKELVGDECLFDDKRVSFRQMLEICQLELAFFTRTPKQLSSSEKSIPRKLNLLAHLYLANLNSESYFYTYEKLHMKYILGITYAVSGNTDGAKAYLSSVARTSYNYPIVSKSRQYLKTKQPDVFFSG